MKLHDSINTSIGTGSNVCRSSKDSLKILANDLEESLGYNAMFYKGCLQFVKNNAHLDLPIMAQIEAFGKRCKQALFVGDESSMEKVDPNQLKAECDRAIYNMEAQFRMLGPESLNTPEEFCAVFVDMVLPIEDEPECMRFLEDVSSKHFDFLGAAHSWPGIIHEPHLEEAFMEACLQDKKLESEEEGVVLNYGDGARDCQMKMDRVSAMHLRKHYKHLAELFSELCPLLGKELPDHEKPIPFQKTRRTLHTALFHRAAKLQARSNISTSGTKKRKKPFSALQIHLDKTVSGKGDDGRRRRSRRRRLTHKQATCCNGEARMYEVGVEASAGVAVDYGQIVAEGFERWRGNDCEYKLGHMGEVCGGLELGAGIDATVSAGWFKKWSDILGKAWFKGGGLCLVGCAGVSFIETEALGGQVIGEVLTAGGGMGIEVSAGWCKCWKWAREESSWERRLKKKCPASDGGCFPSNALVQTPDGQKQMHELRVGEKVLALDSAGALIFDDIYFFGHAQPNTLAAFVRLDIGEVSLELTGKHFIQVCTKVPCHWDDRQTIYAEEVQVGQQVWLIEDTKAEVCFVKSIQIVPRLGLYNPYTLSGNIVVNGVVASAHSSWLLDAWAPSWLQKHLAAIYQAIFFFGRCLYFVAGEQAADFLGVDNPQVQEPGIMTLVTVACPALVALLGTLVTVKRLASKTA